MNEAEAKSRLESLRWSLEEEKTFTERIARAAMEKASMPILRSYRNLDKFIAYMQLKKAECRQSREEHKRLLDLVTDDAARQVLYMRYEQGCTAERAAELLCYSVSMIYILQHKGIEEIAARTPKELRKSFERASKECRNATP
ncbi:hypothetical protein [uncultured Phascolarctobacterium sp.]|uniref:hypothetical protein n=1 Tax=uncultured Phascolarctobacterium sp. TaxID=512296 RepID=UPI0025D68CD2|nr:hypothetical protein [uncultured Phascolarctobacterium sp.]